MEDGLAVSTVRCYWLLLAAAQHAHDLELQTMQTMPLLKIPSRTKQLFPCAGQLLKAWETLCTCLFVKELLQVSVNNPPCNMSAVDTVTGQTYYENVHEPHDHEAGLALWQCSSVTRVQVIRYGLCVGPLLASLTEL